jgi:hypothetical protein
MVILSIRYVAWDITICSKGNICIIEGNHDGDFNLQEAIDLKGKKAKYEKLLEDMRCNMLSPRRILRTVDVSRRHIHTRSKALKASALRR